MAPFSFSRNRKATSAGKVESWRLHVLIEAGYPLPFAERIAQERRRLHEAVELVGRRGCAPEVAAQILL